MTSNVIQIAPGDLLHWDYRIPRPTASKPLRIVQWNIERGYQLDGILRELAALDADILLLQELDIQCSRTRFENVPMILARELKMECVFVCEFHELDCATRVTANRIDHSKGFHGNAILSRLDSCLVAEAFPHSFNLNWEQFGKEVREPRIGQRYVLSASVTIRTSLPPLDGSFFITVLQLYSVHFEVFCGVLGRVRQLGDVLDHARTQQREHGYRNRGDKQHGFSICVGGDFNTMAHGIVRMSFKYGTDRMKLLSLGETEAEWLQRTVLHVAPICSNINGVVRNIYDWLWWRVLLGLSARDVQKVQQQRDLYLFDAFDKRRDTTLDNPTYHGFVTGKFDWLLVSNVLVCNWGMGNHSYSLSDHKYLYKDVLFSPSLGYHSANERYVVDQPQHWKTFFCSWLCRGLMCYALMYFAMMILSYFAQIIVF